MKSVFRASAPSQNFVKWFLIVVAVAGVCIFVWGHLYSSVVVLLGGENFTARVADTPTKRMKGLGGTAPLGKNDAMLFIFPDKGIQTFWMKDLSYPIDIIWFADGEIVDIAPRVAPPQSSDEKVLRLYKPRLPVDRVLEVPAGTADRLGLKIGDKIMVTEN